ncbi:MAG: DUF3365 domain-containing protein [Deltaproteobacteria bacterium]|nr:DUF3365 domain-containing protein [Deltaproteobacteria bacterium]
MLFVCILLIAGIGGSLFFNIKNIDNEYKQLALQNARSVYETIVVAREWNAYHGGLYAPVRGEMQPNPYLDIPDRDIRTDNGALTKINPAFMTRQMSELLSRKKGIQLHITSSNPVNPVNKPSDWEQQALEGFEKGGSGEFFVDASGETPVFRYIAPLKTDESCLQCHAKQGYKVGDVRGGISVSFPYDPFVAAAETIKLRIAGGHIFILLISLSIVFFSGSKLIAGIAALQDALLQIKTLEGLLPVCCNCGKIRVEDGDYKNQKDWVRFEQYISERTDADFSHGICPDCSKKLYPELYNKKKPE